MVHSGSVWTRKRRAPRAARNGWPKANGTIQWIVPSDERAARPAVQQARFALRGWMERVKGRRAVRAADEQVQWTCESDERREPGRAAGPAVQQARFALRGWMERVKGIEPSYAAWEARLNLARSTTYLQNSVITELTWSSAYERSAKL